MCGIVGVIGEVDAVPRIIEGLKRLEYRGYDSAGIATMLDGNFEIRRSQGKVEQLEKLIVARPVKGILGIGHTRWATHGIPSEGNAHPHSTNNVAVVHNGIIENFQELRDELIVKGYSFATDTDTEVVPQLIHSLLDNGLSPIEATYNALKRLEGAFALGIIFAGADNILIGARRGAPLAVGHGEGEMFLASDAMAIAPFTRNISYLEEGDWVVLNRSSATIRDAANNTVERPMVITEHDGMEVGKANYRHFMHKEIHEQPAVIGDTLNSYVNPKTSTVALPMLPFLLKDITRVSIVACGTSYYAGLIARYWIESLASVPVDIDIASEFRYRTPPLAYGGVAIFISQSGETADTLAALRYARKQGQKIISVVNVSESTIERESDIVLPTCAGPEIGVASTKAFSTQLVTLACFAVALARAHGSITAEREIALSRALAEVPARAADVLAHDERIRRLAISLTRASTVIYIGRGSCYPVALEGALKLKEISYIHAEGFAAGELKHGPIALIDRNVPVIVVAPPDELFEKTASNLQEVAARGAEVVFLSDARGISKLGDLARASIELPEVDSFVAPILYTIPVQLLAYHVAVNKGTDVDQPRNLAKSVTVE